MRSLVGRPGRFAIVAVLLAGSMPLAYAQSEDAGFGKDISLGQAVKNLAPKGSDVRFGPGVDTGAKVSWSGGGWQEALTGAARGAGYTVSVKGNKVEVSKAGSASVSTVTTGDAEASAIGTRRPARAEARREERREARREARESRHAWRRPEGRVRVRERIVRAAPERVAAETVSGGGFVMMPIRREPAPVAAPVREARGAKAAWVEQGPKAAPAPEGLVVREGDSLHAVLSDWSAKNGWRLVWNSEFSYRLTAAARFGGGFVESTTELLKSMRAVRPLVTGSFYQGNKTLVVGNESSDGAAQ